MTLAFLCIYCVIGALLIINSIMELPAGKSSLHDVAIILGVGLGWPLILGGMVLLAAAKFFIRSPNALPGIVYRRADRADARKQTSS